jgi:hypothetical protein
MGRLKRVHKLKRPQPIKEFYGAAHNGPYCISFFPRTKNKQRRSVSQVCVYVHVSIVGGRQPENENLIEVARRAIRLNEKDWVARFVHNVG